MKTITPDPIAENRTFLQGPAANCAQAIIEGAGVLSWHAHDSDQDPANVVAAAAGVDRRIPSALDAIGLARRSKQWDDGFDQLMTLTSGVAEHAYLIGIAVGLRLRGGA